MKDRCLTAATSRRNAACLISHSISQSGTSCRFYSPLVVLRDASLIEIQETVWKRSRKSRADEERGPERTLRQCASLNDSSPALLSCACNQESSILGWE